MEVDVLLRVRFGECDPQNVVFNARYADYVDIASTEYLRILCDGYETLLNNGLMTQVVSLHIDWQESLVFDDCVSVTMMCEKVGNTSFKLSFTMTRYEDQIVVASGYAVYVMVDTKSQQKTPVPLNLREKLLEKSVRETIDFAGIHQR